MHTWWVTKGTYLRFGFRSLAGRGSPGSRIVGLVSLTPPPLEHVPTTGRRFRVRRITLLATLVLAVTASCTNRPNLEDGFVDTNGTTLYYKTMGSGEPIVVLHGGPGFDHQQFLPFIWELSSDYKVILYDQRGTGLSSGPVDSASITIDNFIEDIEGIRRAFDIERMNLLGHSWGGILAMHYGISHPDRLKSLILCSTAASIQSFDDMDAAKMRNWLPDDIELIQSIAASEGFQNNDPEAIERFWRVYFRYSRDSDVDDFLRRVIRQ